MSKEKLKNKIHTSHFALHTSKQNGITLIALIITIIVMLILTGVTLSITLGDNGLVNKAKEASNQTQVAMDRELLLSAVVGAMGNDGKVNLSAIVLPEGFTGSNGTYTSKNGNSFTVSENGEILYTGESDAGNNIEQGVLVGKYYALYYKEACFMEINNDDTMTLYEDGDEISFPIIIDYENETITGVVEYSEISLSYDIVVENNKIQDVIIYDLLENGDEDFLGFKNAYGVQYGGIDGEYYNENGDRRISFDSENSTVIYQIKLSDETWGTSSGDEHELYVKYQGVYSTMNTVFTVSEDLNTITYSGTTYTK